jgi:aspartate carbamoyltransferase catalytic subunit
MLRVQQERMTELFFPNAREYSRYYGLNADRMINLKPSALIMHPGPMNRGLEISAEVADSARSVITEQVSNGVSVRMAILYVLLAGSPLDVGSI